jgi:hypothetical protein
MGKRELVLIVVFVALGIGVYQVTAPPPPPGSEGISLSGIFRKMKRGVQGARESANADSAQSVPVEAAVTELRINVPRMSDMTIAGEDRADIAAELHVTARGFDQAEAKAAADAIKLKVERVGDAMVVSLDTTAARSLPRNAGQGPGQMTIALKVPRRMTMRVEPHFGRFVASGLVSAEVMGSRGETRMTGFSGRVALTHSGGELELERIGSLKLNARNSRGTIKEIPGAMTVDAIGGELRFGDVGGPLELEARNTDIRMDDIKGLKPPLRINSTGGEIRIAGLRTEARIDGRNSTIEVALAAAAPVTIYNLGAIRVTAPPGGYTLDAAATEGRITLEDGDLKPSEGSDPRAAGAVRGGGPTLNLRSTRGSITVGKAAGK